MSKLKSRAFTGPEVSLSFPIHPRTGETAIMFTIDGDTRAYLFEMWDRDAIKEFILERVGIDLSTEILYYIYEQIGFDHLKPSQNNS